MQLPKMPSFSLKGRSALIVGASSGIGTACAVALAEHGPVPVTTPKGQLIVQAEPKRGQK